MKRNESFDENARLYDDARPSYPEQLINDFIAKTKITIKDAETYLQTFNSHSNFIVLPDEMKVKLNQAITMIINSNGGIVDSKLIFSLYIANKK